MSSSPILNQGQQGECAGYSMLKCLMLMKPDTDHKKIETELIAEKGNELSIRAVSEWFIKKGYIKGIRDVPYSPIFLRKQPCIVQVFNVNWIETNKAPFMLTYGGRTQVGSHFICLSAPLTLTNSYGEEWGDKGKCYFIPADIRRFKKIYTLVL